MVSALQVPAVVFGVLSVAMGAYYSGYHWTLPLALQALTTRDAPENLNCRPFLPRIFAENPPSADHSSIMAASQQLDQFLSNRFSVGDIDSLSVAVVSADGLIFEGNYGVVRGNESESSPPTTSDSMYRLASVSKLFNVLEGHILAEKSVISWQVQILVRKF